MITEPAGQASNCLPSSQTARDKCDWDTMTTIFSATDNEWPGVKTRHHEG